MPSTAAAASTDTVELTPECTALATPNGLQATPATLTRDEDADNVELNEQVVVSPPRIEITRALEPGNSLTCILTLRSRRSATTTFELTPQGILGSKDSRAGYEFLDPGDEDAGATAVSWLEPMPASVTLEPREVARVPVRVTVPENAPTGARFASINVVSNAEQPGPGETVLGIRSEVAAAFLLHVGGAGQAKLTLDEVEAPLVRWNRDPWRLTAELENSGTMHATSRGRVRVQSIFGNTVAELPIPVRTVLPSGRVPVDVTWSKVPWIGIYRWDARVEDAGDEDVVAHADGWIIALPPWWVLALVAALVAGWIVHRLRRRRLDLAWPEEDADDLDAAV